MSRAVEDGGRGREEAEVVGREIGGGRDTDDWVEGGGLMLGGGRGVDACEEERERGGLGRGWGLSLELLSPSEVSCTRWTALNCRLADLFVDLGVFCCADAELDEGLSCTELEDGFNWAGF